jgi:hypothetical protein
MGIWKPQPVKRGDPPAASKGYVKPAPPKDVAIPFVGSSATGADYFANPSGESPNPDGQRPLAKKGA